MSQSLEELTQEALRLSPDDRVFLAESLLLTIDEAHDRSFDEATIRELERRWQDFREGKVTGIPAEEAVESIRAKFRQPLQN